MKIPKIIPFFNLNMQKSLKKLEKYFQRQFWKLQHAQNIKKITPNERGDQMHLRGVIFIRFCACHSFQNWCWKYFSNFFSDFCTFKLQKGIIFGIFISDMLPKWLLDAFNIHVIYLGKKRYIFILFFGDFFANSKKYPKF